MLVDRPREFIVQLPRNDKHQGRAHRHDDWNDDEKRLRLSPYIRADGVVDDQNRERVFDLLHLDGPVDQKPDIAQTYPDDLDGILQPQRVVH